MATFPLHRPLTLLAMLGAVVLLVVTWSKVATTITNVQPIAPPKIQPTAIVWANRVFSDPGSLRRWLHRRGLSYAAWSSKHPEQAAILEHRPVAHPAHTKARAKVKAQAKGTPRPAQHVPAAQRPRSSIGGHIVRNVVFTLLLLLALVLAFAAASPAALRRRFPTLAYRVARYRGAMGAAATAIVLGIAVSVGLS